MDPSLKCTRGCIDDGSGGPTIKLAAIIPLACFACVCTAVGIRLLRSGLRNREIPELSLGSGIMLIACLGLPLSALGRMPQQTGTPLGDSLLAIGVSSSCVGIELLFVFSWSVFRRHSPSARALVTATGVTLAATAFGLIRVGIGGTSLTEIQVHTRPYAVMMVLMVSSAFAWSAAESLRHWWLQRRRLALGLADPVVTNRFLLWGASGAVTALLCLTIVISLASNRMVLRDPLSIAAVAVMGGIMSVAWWLSFFPPASYERRLRRE